MPIFRYRCRKCGVESTRLVPRFDAGVVCEQCGAPDPEKLPSAFAAPPRSAASRCGRAEQCPVAGGHHCGGGCGCGGH